MYRVLCSLIFVASSLAFRPEHFVPFILNGEDADVGEWPHQCSLQVFSSHVCGAVYLTDTWLATAAHCVYGSDPTQYIVMCGELNLSDSTDTTEFDIQAFYTHPDYIIGELPNDHALIELIEVPSGDNIAAVFADDVGGDSWVGVEDCWITGWGQTDTDSSPDTLQEAQVLALSQADCEDFYEGTGRTVTEDMICVGHDNDIYTGACYGDSGGPFVCRRNPDDGWTLIGITSWALAPCGADFYPSVYSRTAYFRDWINEVCGDCIAN